ncbi:uncharacterized protein LOC130945468 [Arachis stenosperma]|uniref:uncharacterized protein LOC130945468 n=1 Tax=Arachis stenosperma TaxID=217475 RepID=UPI0025AD5135|nr:uncharacterized protein LOC130945468 [Arachis stenosperma]
MVQWAIELSEFDLKYETRTIIKAQCLTDFVAEYAGEQEEASTTWELYAEYEALIIGLKLAKEVSATKVVVFSDSQVVTSQINGEYQAKDPNMKRYLDKTLEYLRRFTETEVKHITRDLNSRADALSKLASTKPGEFDILPKEEKEAKKIWREEQNYTLVKNILCKRGISPPSLKCVPTSRTIEVLEEVHNGICGNYLGARSLARKVIRAGFYWPTLQKDATEFVKKCQPCQMHANFHVAPPEELISITSPLPFTKWGLYLLGPFSQAPGQVKYLIMGVDYFTKWIKAEPLAIITAQRSQRFLYKNIITRYGVPHSIITDNGTQFTNSTFRNLVASMKIKYQFTSVEHPQANGQVEAANKVILAGLKKRL